MRLHFHRSTTLLRFSLRVTAFYVVLLLGTFYAANSSASQLVRGMYLGYYAKTSSGYQFGYYLFHYFLSGSDAPSFYEAWPFLASLQHYNTIANNTITWYPYGYLEPGYGRDPPYFYRYFASYIDAGNVPDDWTSEDIQNITESFNNLTPSQKAACTGSFTAANSTNGDSTTKVFNFNRKTVGSVSNGAVVTYDNDGSVILSYPDNTGYASGYKPNPDGTYQPTYYHFENGVATEVPYIPTQEYSALQYDSETQTYSLNVPDYREKLDLIANKIDGINLTYDPVINVETPSVTVNPTVTVSPDVNVTVQGSDLSNVEASLVSIGNLLDRSLGTDLDSAPSITNEVDLTQEEQNMISRFRTWETGIPVIGSTLDFGLTTLFGRLPVVGQEFDWMDITPTASTSSRSAPGFSLSGYRIHITLENYRNVILAFRGWIIIAEAIYFGILVWKLIREALAV